MSARYSFSLSSLSDYFFGMRGLINYQLSCCVNTLLQTLSATWELGDLLDKWEAADVREKSGNVPLQLKRVLAVMTSDHSRPAPHHEFLYSLDLNHIRLGTQHDADEVFLSILNLLQHQMDDRHLALEIQNLYKISVETCVQCLDCSSIQTLNTYLLSLPLHVKEGHDSLEGCMTSFFKHQELSGINCCFCAQCEKKTPTQKSIKLLSLPCILSVHLKRFRNSNGYTRKLDCRITFPETIDLSDTVKEAFSSDFNQASWEEVQRTYGGNHRGTAYMLMYRRGSKEEVQQPQLSG
ncbi:ubl carboxyl-terminal hydrolase 18 isoform X2 [Eleginops maclovinus]|uniref:ubl carboxyl-terminal hydrolase 18 isoform X2 n=1 Tax=Eleginops maclovinus TaxID=56733 RepID=UPI00307FD0D4